MIWQKPAIEDFWQVDCSPLSKFQKHFNYWPCAWENLEMVRKESVISQCEATCWSSTVRVHITSYIIHHHWYYTSLNRIITISGQNFGIIATKTDGSATNIVFILLCVSLVYGPVYTLQAVYNEVLHLRMFLDGTVTTDIQRLTVSLMMYNCAEQIETWRIITAETAVESITYTLQDRDGCWLLESYKTLMIAYW